MIVRVRVVDYTGNAPGLKRSAKRYLMSLVSDLAFRAGYFAMIRDRDKQTWHDEFGGTYVVKR